MRALMHLPVWAALLAGAAPPAVAGQPAAPALVPLTVSIANDSARDLLCLATLAHWYTQPPVRIPAGQRIALALAVDPASGTVYARNSRGAAMPVEQVFCGEAGRSFETRSLLPIRDAVADGGGVAALRFSCRAGAGRLTCG